MPYKLVKLSSLHYTEIALCSNSAVADLIHLKAITMKKQKTIYHLIVDKSGSMEDVTHQTITGYNEQVQQIQSVQRDFPEQLITIGLTTFNGNVEHFYLGVPAGNASWLNEKSYVPDGSTSLYDAIGSSVQRLEQKSR